jgi:hypothetical protein
MEPQKPIRVLWERLRAADPAEVAARAAVAYDAQGGVFCVPLLGMECRVDPAGERVQCPQGDAGFDGALLCVQYLLTARAEPLAGELANPRSLPYGEFFLRGPHDLPTGRIEQVFGERPERFRAAAEALGGRPVDIGDVAAEFRVLPRVPITVSLWAADDEFPARAQFLVDKWADHQLPLDALWMLCGVVAKRLVAADKAAG